MGRTLFRSSEQIISYYNYWPPLTKWWFRYSNRSPNTTRGYTCFTTIEAPLCIGLIDFQKNFWYITSQYTMENTEALWITTEDCRPHQHSISELCMQCTDGIKSDKQLFSKVKSLPWLHFIPNTLQYSPGLHNETDNNTECTAWYTIDPFLTTRRSRLYRWYCTIIHNSKSSVEEGTASHRKC